MSVFEMAVKLFRKEQASRNITYNGGLPKSLKKDFALIDSAEREAYLVQARLASQGVEFVPPRDQVVDGTPRIDMFLKECAVVNRHTTVAEVAEDEPVPTSPVRSMADGDEHRELGDEDPSHEAAEYFLASSWTGERAQLAMASIGPEALSRAPPFVQDARGVSASVGLPSAHESTTSAMGTSNQEAFQPFGAERSAYEIAIPPLMAPVASGLGGAPLTAGLWDAGRMGGSPAPRPVSCARPHAARQLAAHTSTHVSTSTTRLAEFICFWRLAQHRAGWRLSRCARFWLQHTGRAIIGANGERWN